MTESHQRPAKVRVQSARGAVWQAQLGLRRVRAEMKRTLRHQTGGGMTGCPLCVALEMLRDAERELDARRKDIPDD